MIGVFDSKVDAGRMYCEYLLIADTNDDITFALFLLNYILSPAWALSIVSDKFMAEIRSECRTVEEYGELCGKEDYIENKSPLDPHCKPTENLNGTVLNSLNVEESITERYDNPAVSVSSKCESSKKKELWSQSYIEMNETTSKSRAKLSSLDIEVSFDYNYFLFTVVHSLCVKLSILHLEHSTTC